MDNTFHVQHFDRQDHIIGAITAGVGVVKGVGGILKSTGILSKDRVTKNQFYSHRDKTYKAIESKFGKGAHEKVPGNPFAAFSHSAIHDSPVKDYKNELQGFNDMVATYFPSLISSPSGGQKPVPVTSPAVQKIVEKVPSNISENIAKQSPTKTRRQIRNERTAPELLPKTAAVKQMENEIANSGAVVTPAGNVVPQMSLAGFASSNVGIGIIILLVLVILGTMFKNHA